MTFIFHIYNTSSYRWITKQVSFKIDNLFHHDYKKNTRFNVKVVNYNHRMYINGNAIRVSLLLLLEVFYYKLL